MAHAQMSKRLLGQLSCPLVVIAWHDALGEAESLKVRQRPLALKQQQRGMTVVT